MSMLEEWWHKKGLEQQRVYHTCSPRSPMYTLGPSEGCMPFTGPACRCAEGQRHSVGAQGCLGYLVAVGHQSGTDAVRATWPLPVVLM